MWVLGLKTNVWHAIKLGIIVGTLGCVKSSLTVSRSKLCQAVVIGIQDLCKRGPTLVFSAVYVDFYCSAQPLWMRRALLEDSELSIR